MIVYYTKYNTIESFNMQSLLSLVFECVNGMKNAPESFKNQTWNGEECQEWNDDRNIMTFQIDAENRIIAFRVAIVDTNDELWTTDIVLNDNTHEIQLRLAREKRIVSAEHNPNFNLPFVFKKLIRNGVGGKDLDLPIYETPIYIDEENLSCIADIINKEKTYSLPIIYVSHPFSGEAYEVDVEELAKDMAGSAHVLVEKSSDVSKKLKELTEGKNPYNGAIDIFYSDFSFRYIRRNEITPNQFRYKISHAVYSRMAMRNIDDKSSLSEIKFRNQIKKLDQNSAETKKLALEIESIKEKRKEDSDYIELAHEEISSLNKRINELENENYNLKYRIESLMSAFEKKDDQTKTSLILEYTEKDFYPDEVKRIVYRSLENLIASYGDEEQQRRDFHVLNDIISNKNFKEDGDTIKQKILQIIKKSKLRKTDSNELKSLGFELQNGSHDKYVFHNDDRYIITVSNSPSDYREGENLAHEAVNLLFGRT